MKILVTGANGFIGKNLLLRLDEMQGVEGIPYTRNQDIQELGNLIHQADFVFHLAGVNRPDDPSEFKKINTNLTCNLIKQIESSGKCIPLLLASSTQAELDNPYGKSKLAAEVAVAEFSTNSGNPVFIYRLPNVFGKWCRPEYNSVVATFCHHIANGQPIDIHNPSTNLSLVYIDDVIDAFISDLRSGEDGITNRDIQPVYKITLGELAAQLRCFRESRDSLVTEPVGCGLTRALYATYLSYLEPDKFFYSLDQNIDERGRFVEFLKTKDSGQFSFFTAKPGITRGGHYHHTKSEKFLVVQGKALFKFKHMQTGCSHEITTSDEKSQVVETIPGWAHDITNIGKEELIVLLWANEIFNPDLPDTIGAALDG